MPKYRELSAEELESMQDDFVKFLVLNGIAAEDWEKLKEENPESANGIIGSFSDVVFEKILRKTVYIDFIDKHDIYCVQCLVDKMILVGAKSDSNINFQTSDPSAINGEGLKVYTTEKKYSGDRQKEIYEMLQKGYQISDGSLFKRLCLVL